MYVWGILWLHFWPVNKYTHFHNVRRHESFPDTLLPQLHLNYNRIKYCLHTHPLTIYFFHLILNFFLPFLSFFFFLCHLPTSFRHKGPFLFVGRMHHIWEFTPHTKIQRMKEWKKYSCIPSPLTDFQPFESSPHPCTVFCSPLQLSWTYFVNFQMCLIRPG